MAKSSILLCEAAQGITRMKRVSIGLSFRCVWENVWEQFISDAKTAKEDSEWWEGGIVYKELGDRVKRVLPGEGSPLLYLLLQHLRCFRRLVSGAFDQRGRYKIGRASCRER